jgi:3-methyladenine DNA glycosylase/8-oxoguanine DNA glycosylase
MPATLKIKPPADYLLSRDVCSYGYFLLAPNRWDVKRQVFSRAMSLASGSALIEVSQKGAAGNPLTVSVSRVVSRPERAELEQQIHRMFRLDETDSHIAEFHKVDPRWKTSGRGRVFRSPTLFEDVLKTVTSCNVQWPSTVHMNIRLCEVLGERVDSRCETVAVHTFPSSKKIASIRPQTLRARCRVGYRDQRIVDLARLFCTTPRHGGIDQTWLEDTATSDDAVHAFLVELPGIGPYAAANIMQLLGRYGRLPLDTESVRHGRTVLGLKGSSPRIMKRVKEHFAPFGDHAFRSYWFELWTHYESKHGPSWMWERDSTGKLFTASALAKA